MNDYEKYLRDESPTFMGEPALKKQRNYPDAAAYAEATEGVDMADFQRKILATAAPTEGAPVLVSADYVKAVEDFCVVSWVNPPKPDADYDTVKKALHDVACFDVQIATDPQTNGNKVLIDADELAGLRQFDESVGKMENCSDRHCVIRPNAVGTNGGCKCWDDRHKARLMFAYVKRLRAALAANGEKP